MSNSNTTLHEALTSQLEQLPTVTYANGYLVQAMPKATLLGLLAQHPDDPAPIASRDRLAEVLDPDVFGDNQLRSHHPAAVIQWAARQTMAYEGADRLLAAGVVSDLDDVDLRSVVQAAEQAGSYCCQVGCGGGACESCPCCVGGWCVMGTDGLPDGSPEDLANWLDVAKDHNRLVAGLVAAGLFREERQPIDPAAAGTAAAKAIIFNLPVDGFGQSKRLEEYAAIWGNAAAQAVLALIGTGDAEASAADEEIGTKGHDLVVSFGDCEMHGQCTCGRPLGTIKPDQPLDLLGSAWERHVMTEVPR